MRVILVPVAGRPESAVALDCAFELASGLEADVVGCHVRPHRNMPPINSAAGPYLMVDNERDLGIDPAEARYARDAAHALFDKRASAHEFPLRRKPSPHANRVAIWEEFVGSPGRAMAIVGSLSDLLVLTRPRAAKSEKARAFLLAAVMHASRPVLVLPPRKQKAPGRHIAIGWDQSIAALHSVTAALPLLQRAETVTIVSRGDESGVGPQSKHLSRYLLHWGIEAALDHSHESGTPEALEAACSDAGADLLVIGAYRHSRIRERLFGGVTEHMLTRSKRAVLMLHA